MIETIHNAKNDKRKEWEKTNYMFRMPKNIRQIGQAGGSRKIYMEDYVSTYVKQLTKKGDASCKVAILLGQFVKVEEINHIFISGAIEVKEGYLEDTEFTNEDWSVIYDNIKAYFTNVEVVGWFLSMPGFDSIPNRKIVKLHVDNFAGQDKTLLLYDSAEGEEAFYLYQSGQLCRQNGYYIYYERNPQMQNYMIESGGISSEEPQYEDKVSKKIRTVLKEKQEEEPQKGNTNFIYAVGTLLAVVIIFIGGAVFYNYDQVQNMQDAINVISDHVLGSLATKETGSKIQPILVPSASPTPISDISKEKDSAQKDKTEVETIKGNVTTIKGNKILDDTKKEKKTETAKPSAKPTIKPSTKPTSKPEPTKKPVETSSTKKSAEAAEVNTKKSAAPVYYIVKKGDSLDSISYKFYGTRKNIDKIKTANKIQNKNFIREGRKLRIP